MNFYYYTIKGSENTDLNGQNLTIGATEYSFFNTTKENFDYKVAVSNGTQEQIDKIQASEVDQITTIEDFNAN